MSAELELTIEAPAQVVLGAPLLVAVELLNPLAQRTYYALPKLGRFGVPPPVEFWVRAEGAAKAQVLPAKLVDTSEGPPKGMTLRGGQSRRFLYDVSELWPALAPGRWGLGGAYRGPNLPPVAARQVAFEAVAPTPPSAAALAALRAKHQGGGEPSWNGMLVANFREIEPDELADLDEPSAAAVAMHLWLHRAVYGPVPVGVLDVAGVDGWATGLLEAEGEVVRHELLTARGDPGATALAASVVAKWPGLAWRIEENLAGQGLLAVLRRVVGAERTAPPVPDPLPYGG